MFSVLPSSQIPMKEIHIQPQVGIPREDGGLEIPNRIFLGGIPTDMTELDMELFFSEFGLVKDVRIVSDRVTGKSKGYGFVTFDETVDMSSFFRRKCVTMNGHRLRVRKAVRRNGSSQFKKDSSETLRESNSSQKQQMKPIVTNAVASQHSSPVYLVAGMPQQPPNGHAVNMQGFQQPMSFPITTPTCQCSPAPMNNVYPMYYPCSQIPQSWPILQF